MRPLLEAFVPLTSECAFLNGQNYSRQKVESDFPLIKISVKTSNQIIIISINFI